MAAMEYRRLGRSGLKVSLLSFGSWVTFAKEDQIETGKFGENLTLQGLLETDMWIGDFLRLPHCTLAISEPRLPCCKFDAAMGFTQASKLMIQSGFCGCYLTVIEPGTVEAGETAELLPGPREVNLLELFRARRPARWGT